MTHLHADHLDATAVEALPKEVAVLCQPPDATALRKRGFVDVRPVEEALDWESLRLTRTNGRHGTGEIGERMAPVSGFVITTPDEPTLYIAGDTIWCDEVREAVDRHRPAIIVANAGGARFLEGDPITMTADDVVALARHATGARILAVHLEAINHCVETPTDLRARLEHEQLQERVSVPDDGDAVTLSWPLRAVTEARPRVVRANGPGLCLRDYVLIHNVGVTLPLSPISHFHTLR